MKVLMIKPAPVSVRTESTWPAALHNLVSSRTVDADLYISLRQFSAKGEEILGINLEGKPAQLLARGRLRASFRKLDDKRSQTYRPYHPHKARELLVHGTPVSVATEIWPTSMVLNPGDRFVLEIGSSDPSLSKFKMGLDPADRNAREFNGTNTVHTGSSYPSYLRLPLVPFR